VWLQQARIEECCGFGGTFAIRYPEISEAIVSDKVESLRATGAEQVVSADCGCLFNILGRAAKQDEQTGRSKPSLPGEHIASFLWRRTSGEQS
jgi:L-lactate dehydrogenase complex protein LldE